MRRFNVHTLILLTLSLAASACAQNDPEGTLMLRGVFTGTYAFRTQEQNSGKTGAVTTSRDAVEETWDRLTLIFTGRTKWKYRDGVPVEMQDNAQVTCSGQGGLSKLTKYVTAINEGGEWAPYHYTTSADGSWIYSVPSKPTNEAMPPLMAAGGSAIVSPPAGMYTLILNPYPNVSAVTVEGAWTQRMRPQQQPGSLHKEEDQAFKIEGGNIPPGDPRSRYLVGEAWSKMQELLNPGSGIQGSFDPEQGGFTTSGHLSEKGGPGTQTTRTKPVNDGDRQSTGLTIVSNGNWTADVSWTFTYSRSPVEAIIKPVGDYKKWVPAASTKKSKAGGAVAFKVELRDKKTGGKPKDTTATFTFKLLDSSKHPGSCLNSPWNDTEPDLKILKQDNGGLAKIDEDGQGATSKPKLTECPISVSCFDGGAHGRLQVTADLSDGPDIVAFIEEDGSTQLSLPYDEDGNHIADAWEDEKGQKGKASDADDEQDPPGDRTNGDGLTLWEEYRGFLEDAKHIHGNPKKKDYFICDTVGGRVKPGIRLFASLSKLEVHSDLTIEELGTSRVINRNHGDGPHVVDQHGVVLGHRETDGTCQAISNDQQGPATPKNIIEVVIDPQVETVIQIDGKPYNLLNSTVAHELLHACSVWHHGQSDRQVWWRAETMAGGRRAVHEYSSSDDVGNLAKGWEIAPRQEDGRLLAVSFWNNARSHWLGVRGGQHSGHDDCVMRYDCATAYRDGATRYYLQPAQREIPGFGFCSSPTGTGVNAAGRTPCSRYGDATKGNCVDQIRVKDPF
ncbi:MAG: hypothetical protein ACYC63_10475 [Armatimonadota bacterium]